MVSSGFHDAVRQRSCAMVTPEAKSPAGIGSNRIQGSKDFNDIDETFHTIRREIYRDYILGSCEILRRGVKPGRLLDAMEYRRSLANSFRRHISSRQYPKTKRKNQQLLQVLDYSPYNQQVCGPRQKEKLTMNNVAPTSRYAKYFSLSKQMEKSRPRRLVVKEMLEFNFVSRKKVEIPGCKWMVPKPEQSHTNVERSRSKTPHLKSRPQTRQASAVETLYDEDSFLNCSKKKSAIGKWLSKIENDLVLESIPSRSDSETVEKLQTTRTTKAILRNEGKIIRR